MASGTNSPLAVGEMLAGTLGAVLHLPIAAPDSSNRWMSLAPQLAT